MAAAYGTGQDVTVRTSHGAQVVGSDEIQGQQHDFGPSVTTVKASGAHGLFHGGYAPEAAPLVKQLRDAGWKGTFVSDDGTKDQSFIDNAKSSAEGSIITCPCAPPDTAPDFAAAYKKAFNVDANTYSG